jgi:alcohol dehydrogenase class IV
VKKAIISKKAVPDLALIDPIPLMSLDPYLTACTAMDALTHAIEAYVSNAHSALADIHALESVKIITENLQDAVSDNSTIVTMSFMMLGSIEAGMAFSNASLGAVHAMAHSLGGLYDLPHGECNSVLLGYVIEYNFDSAPQRYRKIAEQMGIPVRGLDDSKVKTALLEKIGRMRDMAGILPFIAVKGSRADADKLAEHALNDPCMVTNPRSLAKEEVKEIYERVIRFTE